MFCWPLTLTPLSLGGCGLPREATLEVTPRGAVFTLAALSHVGHPAHLALADAYLKGQMRLTPSTSIGEDTRRVVTALAAPLTTAHELGLERITLGDLVLLPRWLSYDADDRRNAENGPLCGPDSLRFLLRAPHGWVWVRTAEWFERAGCAGTPRPGETSPWYDAIVSLPRRPHDNDWFGGDLTLPPIEAEVREAAAEYSVSDRLVHTLGGLAGARFARAATPIRRAAEEAIHLVESVADDAVPLDVEDLRAEQVVASRVIRSSHRVDDPRDLAAALSGAIQNRRPTEVTLAYSGREVDVSLMRDLDGYQTLCLLPPTDADSSTVFESMRDLASETIEALIGRPLPERRTEPIALRLVAVDGRSTTLDVGASVVIGRNQTVFTCWVGSDGRVMLKLFPSGGMTVR